MSGLGGLVAERIVGPDQTLQVVDAAAIDVDAVWQRIEAVPGPEPDPPLPQQRPWVAPRGAWLRTPQAIRLRLRAAPLLVAASGSAPGISHDEVGAAVGILLAVLACMTWPWQLPRTPDRARTLAAQAERRWGEAMRRWREEASSAVFRRQRDRLKALRLQLRDPGKELARWRAELPERSRRRQFADYLDTIAVATAEIPGISARRKADLCLRGIVTAADVERHEARIIHGFGNATVRSLRAWCMALQAGFVFDPDCPPDPRDVCAIEEEFQTWKAEAAATFARGPATLQATAQAIAQHRRCHRAALWQAWHDYQLALLSREPE